MTASPNDVAIELERLRGTCAEGFAQVKGSLAVLVERSDRTEADLRDLDARTASVEKLVWRIAGGSAVLSFAVSLLAAYVFQVLS